MPSIAIYNLHADICVTNHELIDRSKKLLYCFGTLFAVTMVGGPQD